VESFIECFLDTLIVCSTAPKKEKKGRGILPCCLSLQKILQSSSFPSVSRKRERGEGKGGKEFKKSKLKPVSLATGSAASIRIVDHCKPHEFERSGRRERKKEEGGKKEGGYGSHDLISAAEGLMRRLSFDSCNAMALDRQMSSKGKGGKKGKKRKGGGGAAVGESTSRTQ